MEKPAADNTELVDYNDEEDAQVTATALPEPQDSAEKGHYAGVGASGFQSFFLKDEIMKAISECGFEHPSEVQSQCIPKALMKEDILCQARSGMGKTCVFIISVLQNIKHSSNISCIVFCHTREMVVQTSKEFHRLSKYLPDLVITDVFGGMSQKKNVAELKNGCDILIGTPQRIADLFNAKAINVREVKYFVVDECDEQFQSLQSRRAIQEVFRSTPIDKQVMMFTATLSPQAKTVCMKYMQNPLCIEIDDKKLTLHGLKQFLVRCEEGAKNRRLTEVLDNTEFNQVVIYVSSHARAMALQKLMESWCFPCIALTSAMRTNTRMHNFLQFKEGKARILVTTSLFGRGVDVEKVNLVINYDFPVSSNEYLHQVGRAGRFGTNGMAVSFVSSPGDEKILAEVESRFETKMTELKGEITKESLNV